MSAQNKSVLQLLLSVLAAVLLVVLLNTFVLANHRVLGPSMAPNFLNNDRAIVGVIVDYSVGISSFYALRISRYILNA